MVFVTGVYILLSVVSFVSAIVIIAGMWWMLCLHCVNYFAFSETATIQQNWKIFEEKSWLNDIKRIHSDPNPLPSHSFIILHNLLFSHNFKSTIPLSMGTNSFWWNEGDIYNQHFAFISTPYSRTFILCSIFVRADNRNTRLNPLPFRFARRRGEW